MVIQFLLSFPYPSLSKMYGNPTGRQYASRRQTYAEYKPNGKFDVDFISPPPIRFQTNPPAGAGKTGMPCLPRRGTSMNLHARFSCPASLIWREREQFDAFYPATIAKLASATIGLRRSICPELWPVARGVGSRLVSQ